MGPRDTASPQIWVPLQLNPPSILFTISNIFQTYWLRHFHLPAIDVHLRIQLRIQFRDFHFLFHFYNKTENNFMVLRKYFHNTCSAIHMAYRLSIGKHNKLKQMTKQQGRLITAIMTQEY